MRSDAEFDYEIKQKRIILKLWSAFPYIFDVYLPYVQQNILIYVDSQMMTFLWPHTHKFPICKHKNQKREFKWT